eukprot:4385581-Prorocentrum_lima.AAC.1
MATFVPPTACNFSTSGGLRSPMTEGFVPCSPLPTAPLARSLAGLRSSAVEGGACAFGTCE